MKKFLFAIIIVIMASCSTDNPEAVNKKIIRYKTKVNALNEKINQLEILADSLGGKKEEVTGTVVTVKRMAKEPFMHFIFVSGKVEAVEEAWVSPETNGQIKKILVKEGQRVNAGQLLVTLSTEITESSMKEVETGLELQKKLYEKQKELWDQNIGTEVQYLQAKTAYESAEARLATLKTQYDMARIKAPFDGIVEDIPVKEGELAMPGARLLHLVNLKDLKINARISETYMNSIHKGDEVEVKFPDNQDITRTLRIARIGNVIENQSRTFEIELAMSNPGEVIKPNQLATMKLVDYSTDSAFVVPSIILKQDITGYYLYSVTPVDDEMVASKIYVKPGRSAEDMTMIEDGLKDGQDVIIQGYNLVKDGTPVRIISE